MKDYTEQIRTIIVSNFKLDTSSNAERDEVPGLSGLSITISQLNRMIQDEVFGLESEIVNLNDQLIEYDSLHMDLRKKASGLVSFSDTRHRGVKISNR